MKPNRKKLNKTKWQVKNQTKLNLKKKTLNAIKQ